MAKVVRKPYATFSYEVFEVLAEEIVDFVVAYQIYQAFLALLPADREGQHFDE